MGMFHNHIQINFDTLQQLLNELVSNVPEAEKSPLIVRLRGTWLLEKVARSSRLFKEERKAKLALIFEPLCDYFSKNDQFVIQY